MAVSPTIAKPTPPFSLPAFLPPLPLALTLPTLARPGLGPRRARRATDASCAADGPLAWIAHGVSSATAAAWALVAQNALQPQPRNSGGGGDRFGVGRALPGRRKRERDARDARDAREGRMRSSRSGQFLELLFEDRGDSDAEDDDGLAERTRKRGRRRQVLGKDAGEEGEGAEEWDGAEEEEGAEKEEEEEEAEGRRGEDDEGVRAKKRRKDNGDENERTEMEKPKEKEKARNGGGFFSLGRKPKPKVKPPPQSLPSPSPRTYGGLTQARVFSVLISARGPKRNDPLHTLLPYTLQKDLFNEMKRTRRYRRSAVVIPIKPDEKAPPVAKVSGMKATVPVSRDVLWSAGPWAAAAPAESAGSASSGKVLDAIQRDIGNLDRVEGANGAVARKGGERERRRGLVGWVAGFFQGGERVQEVKDVWDEDDFVLADDAEGDVESDVDGEGDFATGSAAVSSEPTAPLDVPLNMVGELLNAVWGVRGHEESAAKEKVDKSNKQNAAAYATAMTTDHNDMDTEESEYGGGGAAMAFAAASAIVSSSTASKLDAIEAAGLQASVTAARAISSVDDADVFLGTVGVGALVTAVRVLDSEARSSALTALANIAILRPSSRVDMLKADSESLVPSIANALIESERFKTVSTVVDRDSAICKMEALVSGAHVLGSLALVTREPGPEWRRRMATDASLLKSLKKLTGGVKKGEPEGAARAARRALGALGINTWTPRTPGQRGLRILTIDGGGTRAVFSLAILKHLEELTGAKIADMFDVIGGTSTGAIVAASLGIAHKSVEEVDALYRRLIGKIFLKNSGLIGSPMQVSKLVLTKAFYNTAALEESLKRECGTGVFIDSLAEEGMSKVFVVSSIMSRNPKELHVFRNYTYPLGHESRYAGTSEAQLWEALRASSAAPTFFTEIKVNGELHADGAVMANNPTAIALHEAKCMYPGVPIECVISLGNGLTEIEPSSSGAAGVQMPEVNSVGWGDVVGSIVGAATSTETVHNALSDLFPSSKYFRFNPRTQSNEIDEIAEEKLADFIREAEVHIAENKDRFEEAARLLRPRSNRSLWRRFQDALADELSSLSRQDDVNFL